MPKSVFFLGSFRNPSMGLWYGDEYLSKHNLFNLFSSKNNEIKDRESHLQRKYPVKSRSDQEFAYFGILLPIPLTFSLCLVLSMWSSFFIWSIFLKFQTLRLLILWDSIICVKRYLWNLQNILSFCYRFFIPWSHGILEVFGSERLSPPHSCCLFIS